MATYYVDSNATGLNDGSSWTDAWTSIASTLTIADGDTVLIASDHSETHSGLTINFGTSTPSYLISTNKTTGAYEAGAEFLAGASGDSVILNNNARIQGVSFQTGANMKPTAGTNGYQEYYEVTFSGLPLAIAFAWEGISILGGGLDAGVVIKFVKCTFDFTHTYGPHKGYYNRLTLTSAGVVLEECNFIDAAGIIATGGSYGLSPSAEIRNCDLSSINGLSFLVMEGGGKSSKIYFSKCKLPSSYNLTYATLTGRHFELLGVDCDDGVISSQEGVSFKRTFYGDQTTSITEYRTSGANDGTNDFSWKIVSNANAIETYAPFESSIISRYVESGSQTITVYVAGGASLNDDDFWIEVESPSEEVSPTAQGKFRTTKPDPLATPTALTSDTSSTWNGSGVGTKQKIEVPISPTIAGTVTVRCYLAKPSTTVYVDPKISSDGYQYVYQGVLVDGYPVVSATTPPSSATFSQIIDNGGVGYSLIGSWSTYSGAVPGKYGGDYNYTSSGTGSKVATWSFTGLRRGIYQVSVSWAYDGSHTTSANYKAYSGNSLRINQTKNQTTSAASDYVENGVPFENLGGTFVVSGGSLTVTLDDSQTSGLVIADAVRIELVSEIESESGTQIFPFRQWVEDKAIAGTTTPLTPVHPLRSN
jgi:hypothetical protein